jgi:superfamily I DNA and RNA helicase
MIQMFPDPALWLRLGYRETQGDLDFDRNVVIERDPKSVPDFFGKLLNPEDSLQVRTVESQDIQYDFVAKTIAKLLAEEELQHSDILVVIPSACAWA